MFRAPTVEVPTRIRFLLVGLVITPAMCLAGDKGTATVNGRPSLDLPVSTNVAAAKGISLAGARVYHPDQEDYQVSRGNGTSRAAVGGEIPPMQALTDTVVGLVRALATQNSNVPMSQRVAEANAAFVAGANTLAPAGANFPLQDKPDGTTLLARTQRLHNDNAFEEAGASIASQTVTNGHLQPVTTAPTHAEARQEPHALAAAYAIIRDPLAVQWNGIAQIKVSLGDTNFELGTSGPSGAAVAAFNLTGAFVNGTLDLNTPESSATPLFNLSVVPFSLDGMTQDVFNLNYTGDLIQDSLGNVGLSAVESGLSSQFVSTGDGQYGFSPGYSITFNIPGNPTDSVLFLNEDDASVSQAAVPEPSTLIIIATAALSWLGRSGLRSLVRVKAA